MRGLPAQVGLVQDALPYLGGAEKVLEAVLELVPSAPLHTLVYDPSAFQGTPLARCDIRTSWLDHVPFARSRHRALLPLYPWAMESLDVREYDAVLSFSYAAAHGVLVRPDQLHVCYTYTPLRHAWHARHEFLASLSPLSRVGAELLLRRFRQWDVAAARRVDRIVAISSWIARCIRRAWGRSSRVIYPPVEVDAFEPLTPREDHYVAVGRLAPHKRTEVLLEAFRHLPRRLLVVGEGSERSRLESRAPANVEFLGRVPRDTLRELLGRARALVHVAEEDFGIALVEAQAAGCPVVAYAGGGASEIIVPGQTGVLFHEPNPDAAVRAIREFESVRSRLRIEAMMENARRFSRDRFQREFGDFLEREWESFRKRGHRVSRSRSRDIEAA